jgi:hypothetical protein
MIKNYSMVARLRATHKTELKTMDAWIKNKLLVLLEMERH